MENSNIEIDNINNKNVIENSQEVTVNADEIMNALKHFNWGAFYFSWLWGLGNGSFRKTWHVIIPLSLLVFLPGFTTLFKGSTSNVFVIMLLCYIAMFIMGVFYGLKGNEWAYKNRAWWSITDFDETQKRWATATAVLISLQIIGILTFVILLGGAMALMMSGAHH